MKRHRWAKARPCVASMVLLASAVAAHAQSSPAGKTYPTRPIRLIVPQSPGGPSDIIARLTSQKLSEVLGQSIVMDHRPGAAGNVGCEIAAKAAPDGYTLLLGTPGCLGVNVSLYKNLPYDPLRDFAPITQLTSGPQMVVVHPSVPARSVKELVALARAKPGALNYASGGAGTANHLAAELFKLATGTELVHVPYKGTGPAMTALVGGQVQMMLASLPPALPQVKAGKLTALAITSPQRSSIVPELPTVAESGYPGFETASWHGIVTQARTPRAIVVLLSGELRKMLSQPDVKERYTREGLETVGSTPEEFTAHIRREQARYAKIIKVAGIKPE